MEASVHLDRSYDSATTRREQAARRLIGEISHEGEPAPFKAGLRWVVGRTNSWHNAQKKLVWCTEKRGRVIEFWVSFSDVVIIVRRLIRESWSRFRWEGRPSRRPWPIDGSSKRRIAGSLSRRDLSKWIS